MSNFISRVTSTDNYLPYTISPFMKKHVLEYERLISARDDHGVADAIRDRHSDMHFMFTPSGRTALEYALDDLGLTAQDNIWIETTSNNYYISSCVTKTIERFCSWSRSYNEKTKAILINHEFGFPVEGVGKYKRFNLPIIEDCAFSFLSDNSDNTVGKVGDYLLISFPKFLPVPFGGGLYSRREIANKNRCGFKFSRELSALVRHFSECAEQNKEIRRRNYFQFSELLREFGFFPRFKMEEHHAPGVFMFSAEGHFDLDRLKIRLNNLGIQSSVFYGESAYFVPCHQEMDVFDVEYISNKIITLADECVR